MSTIACPKCGKQTRDERYCQYCREPFYVSDPQSTSVSSCTCGSETSLDAKYCPICGGTLQQDEPDWVDVSGEGTATVIPDSVKGWNWGAFFMPWIWGPVNRTYIGLLDLILIFIPPFSLVFKIVFGAKGNEWAWKNKKWDSLDNFNKIQKRWATVGFTIILISFTLVAASTVLLM